tara:strand:+ start:3931 stop:4209 length:279 start_codon:yes stop_codon:yes gene_type:complete
MSSNLDMLIEERKFAQEAGDMDKVMEIDAMIQLHFGNQPQGGEAMGRAIKLKYRSKGSPKGGEILKKKKKKTKNVMRGTGAAIRGTKFSGVF